MVRKFVLASVSAMTLVAAQGAWAQDKPVKDAGEAGIQDIVITATRQATNLQDTPIAVTAVTSETLVDRGLKSTADLSAVVPNATFRRVQGAFGPGVSAFIRGIGQADTSLGSEPSVAYYVDDVYYPLILGSNFDLLDLDHIEVLRGPQGTLFGRNALAGAVNIVSKQPSLSDSSAYVEVTAGSYKRMDVRAGFNLPLTKTLAFSLSGLSKSREGYQRVLDFRCEMIKQGTPALAGTVPFTSAINTPASNFTPDDCTVGRLGGEDVRALRGSLLWEPAPNVKLTLISDYTRDKSANPADKLVGVPGVVSANLKAEAAYFGVAYDNRFVTGTPFTTYSSYCDPVGAGVVVPGDSFHNGRVNRGGACFSPETNLTNWGVSGKLVVDLGGDITLTGIAGYRKMTESHAFDIDGSPLVLEHTLLDIGEDYKNLELRLSGKSDLVDWVVGGFYFDGDGFTHAITYSPTSGFYKIQNIFYTPGSKAVFANATFKPIERLELTVGGRYSHDDKNVDYSNVLDTNLGVANPVGDTVFKVHPDAERFDWKLGAAYHVNDNVMAYASASTGARLPGYNPRPQQQSQVVTFDGEETLAYELGIKADLFDRKLRVNVAGFYTDYKTRITGATGAEINLTSGSAQPGTCVLMPFAAGGAGATTCRSTAYSSATDGPQNPAGGIGVLSIPRTYYVNTPGKVKGFEVELDAKPIDGLSINAAVGYSRFTSPDLQIATRANDRLAGVPEWNASAGIQYKAEVEMLHGSITPRLDWIYTGDIKTSAARNTYNQPAYALVNSRLTYANYDHDFTVAVGATNLFNKDYFYNFFIYQDIGFPNVNGQPGKPREWFVTVKKNF